MFIVSLRISNVNESANHCFFMECIPHMEFSVLTVIAKHMHWGRQEDAHEFLRYVVDSMQKSILNGHTK